MSGLILEMRSLKACRRELGTAYCNLLKVELAKLVEFARVSPGGGFVVGGAFAIQGLLSEMELFLHDLNKKVS